ncbi:hypothetical protein COBT_002894, partial [Conglomerata obtusa]
MWLSFFHFIYHCVVCDERIFEQEGVEKKINDFLDIFKEDFNEDTNAESKDKKLFLETLHKRINEYIEYFYIETPLEIYNLMVEKTDEMNAQKGNNKFVSDYKQLDDLTQILESLKTTAIIKYFDMTFYLKSYFLYNYLTLIYRNPVYKNCFNLRFLDNMFLESKYNGRSLVVMFDMAVSTACHEIKQPNVLCDYFNIEVKKFYSTAKDSITKRVSYMFNVLHEKISAKTNE